MRTVVALLFSDYQESRHCDKEKKASWEQEKRSSETMQEMKANRKRVCELFFLPLWQNT